MPSSDLFALPVDPSANLLPCDGIVNDYGQLLSACEADALFATLLAEVPWRHDEVRLFGRHITTARQVAWYGDSALTYTYSGITRTALPWHPAVLAVKTRIEETLRATSPATFNSCLLNHYADGAQGMAWHSDDEAELGAAPLIASLSLGAARKFAFKHKTHGEKRELFLHHGQLIVMRGTTQSHWLHAVMKSTRVKTPRISLTFRTIGSTARTP